MKEVYGAGIYDDEQIVRIGAGGDDASTTIACDEIRFRFTLRQMEVARLELSRPDLIKMRRFVAEMAPKSAEMLAGELSSLLPRELVTTAIASVHGCIYDLYNAIGRRLPEIARAGGKINVTIPPIPPIPDPAATDAEIIAGINRLAAFVDSLNIRAIVRENVARIAPIDVVKVSAVQLLPQPPAPAGSSAEELIDGVKKILEYERPVYMHAIAREQLFCKCINKLAEIADAVTKLCGLVI